MGIALAIYGWQVSSNGWPSERWMIVAPLIAATCAFLGSRWREHGDRVAWMAIAGSCAMTAASYALVTWQSTFGLHDAAALASLMRAPDRTLVALALLAMIADRSPIRDRYLAIESSIVALSTALVMWVAVIEPALTRSPLDSSGRLLSLSLPASDLVLVALGARLSLGYRARSRSFVALQLALVARFVANMLSYWGEVGSGQETSLITNVTTAASFAFLVWAALDKGSSEPVAVAHNAVRLSRVRLASILLSAVAPQIVLVVLLMDDSAKHTTVLFAAGIAAVVSLLALTRLWGLAVSVRNLTERRGNDRLASLVERSSDVVVLVDGDGVISYTSPALQTVLGFEDDAWVGQSIETLDVRATSELRVGLWMDVMQLPPDRSLALEVSAMHGDGERRMMEFSAVNLMENVAVAGIVLTLRDVTANRTLERQLSYRADHDSLTGLANRAHFLTRVSEELQRDSRPTVMFLDLDDFKAINDGLGHAAGDVLLRTVADRLKIRFANASNVVARLGGDEFGILLVGNSGADAGLLAQEAITDLKEPINVNDFQSLSVTGCIGVAVGEAKNTASDLMRHADLAMYRAKQLGKGQVEEFDADLGRLSERRNEYKRDLSAALGRDQLYLNYQPIVRLVDGRTVGAEALLRWDHHIYGNVPPTDFIPLAEQSGVIIPIGAWAIEHACISAAGWADEDMFVTVNVSGVQLREDTFVDGVLRSLQLSGLGPERLVLEITESTLIEDNDFALEQLRELRSIGVRTALDDFGTGYSSLAYVQRLPLDVIKIDKEFVQSVEDPRSQALANTIVTMARNLDLRTVAEGVETESQAVELAALGCDFAQGYLFFKPLSATAMTALAEFERRPAPAAPPIKPAAPAAAPQLDAPKLDAPKPVVVQPAPETTHPQAPVQPTPPPPEVVPPVVPPAPLAPLVLSVTGPVAAPALAPEVHLPPLPAPVPTIVQQPAPEVTAAEEPAQGDGITQLLRPLLPS
jgi:diguanylate cyclase (GGDEF)-like protein/PAS domain S-box-containing protein